MRIKNYPTGKFIYLLIIIIIAGFLWPNFLARSATLLDEGFDNFNTGTRPAGWTFTDCNLDTDTYVASGNYGAAPPSVKLDSSTDSITTTTFSSPDALSFWIKGISTDNTSHLLVEEFAASWSTLTDILLLPTTGTTIGSLSLNPSSSQLKFSYSKLLGNLAFDDVFLTDVNKTPTPPPTPTPSPTPTSAVTPTAVGYKSPTPPPTPVENEESLTLCTTNIMAFKYRYGDPAARIFQGLEPDIVSVQEFSVQSTYSGVREWVDTAFGADFDYYIEDAGAANGIISRWTISTAGTWEDVGHESLGRNFAWAVIDIPGDKDLQIVSVHLKAGSTTSDKLIREDQAGQLKDYMQAAFDMQSHYAVLAGDMNAYSRQTSQEPCLAIFATYLDYNDYIPMDRDGNSNTNSRTPRDEPYDWIMPNTLFKDRHITTNIGQAYTSFQTFTAGHVFDTHIFVPLSAVPPALYDDLYYEGITHRPVLKSYHVDDSRDIVVDEGFTGFTDGVRPSGWIFTGCDANSDTYTQSGYYGSSSPSIKLSTDGDQITTRTLYDATSLQFWMRGSATDDTTSLLVEDQYGGEWYPLGEFTYLPNSSEGVTVGPLNLYNPTDRIRFTLNKTLGNIAIDDIIIRGIPSDATPTPVGFFTPTPSPTPTVTPAATPTPVGFLSPTPTPSLPPTPSPTPSNVPTASPTMTPTPTLTPESATPTPPNLTLEYATYLGGTGRDLARGIDINGGYAYVAGYTKSTTFPVVGAYQSTNAQSGKYDVWVSKFSSTGSSLVYSTYLGGTGNEYGNNLTVDSSGQAYVVGTTYSYNFPMAGAYQSSRTGTSCAFLTKVSGSGSALIYSTYLGGNDDDYGYGVYVENDTPYLAGYTKSADFPVADAYQTTHGGSAGSDNDVFVSRFASTGTTLIYSTYLGGTADDNGRAVVTSGGEIYLAGITSSSDFPTVGAYQPALGGGSDAFAVKFTSDGSALLYSTYLGGNDGDSAYGIAVDSTGSAYLAGDTFSSDFPVVSAYQSTRSGSSDAFITRFASNGGSLTYSTYFGGNDLEYCYGVEVEDEKPAITGSTKSTDFPVVNPYQSSNAGDYDAFVARFNSAGSTISYSTYLGGTGEDEARGLALASPRVYIAGHTESSDFPVVNAYQLTLGSSPDAFAARLFYPADAPSPTPSASPLPTAVPTATPVPTPEICTRLDEGFKNFDTGTRPAGWTFTGCNLDTDTYTTAGNFGYLSPSIKLDATDDSIETESFSAGEWLQFWVKGQGTDASSHLLVEEYHASWTTVTDISSLPTTGTQFGNLSLNPSTSQLKFTYTKFAGDLAFDDVLVKCLITPTPSPTSEPTATPTTAPTALPSPTPDNYNYYLVLDYSSYLGGGGSDCANGIAVDGSDAAYVVGSTNSSDFPTTSSYQAALAGSYDTVVAKLTLNPSGSLVYATYLGGAQMDIGLGIDVDDSGSACVIGYTMSEDFPTANAYQATHGGGTYDAFVSMLSTGGDSLTYSSYLGGSGLDAGLGVALATDGRTYLAGYTQSADFPTENPYQAAHRGTSFTDIFVTAFASGGTEISYSTYLGGGATDQARGVALDGSGCAYLVGRTESTDFPTENAYQPVFGGGLDDVLISKISSSGSLLLFSTYLGGSGSEQGHGISLNGDGEAHITGNTLSTDFPVKSSYQSTLAGGSSYGDGYLARLNSSGSALVYSTYLGGSGEERGYGVAVDADGYTYATGWTTSTDFPLYRPYQDSYGGGTRDVFLSSLVPAGDNLAYSTYLGGSGTDSGRDTVLDSSNRVCLAGETSSTDFPLANAYQTSNAGGGSDIFISRIEKYGHLTTPTPSPTVTPSPSATPTVALPTSPTPVPTASSTPTPAGFMTPSPTASPTSTPDPAPTAPHLVVDWDDYDGDGSSDIAVYDPASGEWNIRNITSGVVWGGSAGDIPAPGDYDGDGTADLAYFDRYSGLWYVKDTITGAVITEGVIWGAWGDVPAPGDYDGDGVCDFATWRPSDGRWRIMDITNIWYGQAPGMYPVPGDYNGDGTTDIAMMYPGSAGGTNMWYVNGIGIRAWMTDDGIAIPLDYDGDGTTDLGVFNPSNQYWCIRHLSSATMYFKHWGIPGDIPVVGDFDGDGIADLTTFRNASGQSWWWILYSSKPYYYSNFSAQTTDSIVIGATGY